MVGTPRTPDRGIHHAERQRMQLAANQSGRTSFDSPGRVAAKSVVGRRDQKYMWLVHGPQMNQIALDLRRKII
jgi:hypothetical protein